MEKEVKSFDVAMEMINDHGKYLGHLYHVDDEMLSDVKDFCNALDKLYETDIYAVVSYEIEIDDSNNIVFTIGTYLIGADMVIPSTEFYDAMIHAKTMVLYNDENEKGLLKIKVTLPGVWKIKLH